MDRLGVVGEDVGDGVWEEGVELGLCGGVESEVGGADGGGVAADLLPRRTGVSEDLKGIGGDIDVAGGAGGGAVGERVGLDLRRVAAVEDGADVGGGDVVRVGGVAGVGVELGLGGDAEAELVFFDGWAEVAGVADGGVTSGGGGRGRG